MVCFQQREVSVKSPRIEREASMKYGYFWLKCERCVKLVLTFDAPLIKLKKLTSAPILEAFMQSLLNRQFRRPARQRSNRSGAGSAMAELPFILFILFIGLLAPLMILASIGYRGSILYFAADSAVRKAAKAPTFTDANSRAAAVLTTNLGPFSGISVSAPTLSILVKPIAGGTPTVYTSKLAAGSVDSSKSLYFVMQKVDADLSPLVAFNGGWMGLSIPGLTQPFHLTFNQESYAENPTGLTQ